MISGNTRQHFYLFFIFLFYKFVFVQKSNIPCIDNMHEAWSIIFQLYHVYHLFVYDCVCFEVTEWCRFASYGFHIMMPPGIVGEYWSKPSVFNTMGRHSSQELTYMTSDHRVAGSNPLGGMFHH